MKKLIGIALVMAMATTTYGATLDLAVPGGNDVVFDSGVGGTFDIAVSVDPAPGTYFKGLSLFLTEATSAGMYVSARTIDGVQWAWGPYVVDPTTSDTVLFSPKNADARTLAPSTADLGATTNNPAYGDPAGQLMTLTITVPATVADGVYTITAAGSTYVKNDNSAGDFDMMNDIIVSVPEPASLALLALGGLALVRRR